MCCCSIQHSYTFNTLCCPLAFLCFEMDEWPQFQHSKPGVCYQKGPLVLYMRTESEELELYNYMETSGGWVLQEDLDLQFLYAQKEKFLDMTMEVS